MGLKYPAELMRLFFYSLATVDGWTVEFFISFELMTGLGNIPPKAGTTWRANICRLMIRTHAGTGSGANIPAKIFMILEISES
jgi:hypothetical protein